MNRSPFLVQLSLCILLTIPAFGQQESQYSMYMLNPFAFNPAFSGMDYSLSATGVFRRQWVDVEFTPTTQQVNVHAPVALLRGGVGLSFDNDQYGAQRMSRFGAAYAYHLLLGEGTLSLGVQANTVQRRLDGNALRTPEGIYTDGSINHNDPILGAGDDSGSSINFDAGIYYQRESWEMGLGIRNLTEAATELNALSFRNVRHYTFSARATVNLTAALKLRPNVMVQSDAVQTQVALGALAEYNDNIFLGAAFRGYDGNSRDAVAIIGGFQISPNLKLAYAYDLTLSGLQQVSSGSHEILLNYNLNQQYIFSRPPNTIYHPRAF